MNNVVLQCGILSKLMLGNILVLFQELSKRGTFRVNEWVFYPINLYRTNPR